MWQHDLCRSGWHPHDGDAQKRHHQHSLLVLLLCRQMNRMKPRKMCADFLAATSSAEIMQASILEHDN